MAEVWDRWRTRLPGWVAVVVVPDSRKHRGPVHGSYRRVQETPGAIERLLDAIESARPAAVHLYFDRPVSNSGRLAAAFRENLEKRSLSAHVSLVANADRALLEDRGERSVVVFSTDGQVLDAASAWFDVAGHVVRRFLPQAWVVDLRRSGNA